MDIQVSSNAERLLFELYERNAARCSPTAWPSSRTRAASRPATPAWPRSPRCSTAPRSTTTQTRAEIRRTYEATGEVLDPHTAVGVAAARAARRDPDVPMICLATAHPAKFPDAVEQAIGIRPELPEHLADLFDRDESLRDHARGPRRPPAARQAASPATEHGGPRPDQRTAGTDPAPWDPPGCRRCVGTLPPA